jgi:hypothetical protein
LKFYAQVYTVSGVWRIIILVKNLVSAAIQSNNKPDLIIDPRISDIPFPGNKGDKYE